MTSCWQNDITYFLGTSVPAQIVILDILSVVFSNSLVHKVF